MSTPQPDPTEVAQPSPSIINWYFGPTAWDNRTEAMWHADCPDPYSTGHDGEVWLDHRKGAFCTGCRHYEEGQQEQDIPPQRLAEIPPQPKPWEVPSPATPDPTAQFPGPLPKGLELSAVFQPTAQPPQAPNPFVQPGYVSALDQVIGQTASTMPALPPEVESLDPTQDQPFTFSPAVPFPTDQQTPEPALVDEQPSAAPAQYATEETHPGILARIKDAL